MLRILEIVTLRDHLGYTLIGLACGLVVTGAGIVDARPSAIPAVPAPAIAVTPDHEVARVSEAVPVHEDAPPPPSSDVHVVFAAGGATYMAIEDLDSNRLPRHGKARVLKDDYLDEAIATVAEANVPTPSRAWAHREVIVGGSCRATVTGFAIVTRVNGDPGWSALAGEPTDHWTAASLFATGNVVLAAKLDRCTGGAYARDAASPAVTAFEDVIDPVDTAAAAAALVASSLGAGAAKEWKDYEQHGNWFDGAKPLARAVRDPRTGTTWISTHAHVGFSCGGPDINIWGLFRVERDGALTMVQLRKLGDMVEIDRLIDVDGDGVPELLGTTWLGPSALLTTADGTELGRLSVPFLGCPC